jgi:hypothetical protein
MLNFGVSMLNYYNSRPKNCRNRLKTSDLTQKHQKTQFFDAASSLGLETGAKRRHYNHQIDPMCLPLLRD